MDAIYDHDRLDPVIAGTIPPGFSMVSILPAPVPGAFMRWRLAKRGGKIPPDLPLGGTASEKQLRAENEAWLAGGKRAAYLPPRICRIRSCDAFSSATADSRCGSMYLTPGSACSLAGSCEGISTRFES